MTTQDGPVQVVSPYIEGYKWLKGNLHTHTTRSDGARPPEEVIADYEDRGYDFLSISDHDVLVDLAPYRKSTSMTLIPGVEVTANGPHILHVNASDRVAPLADRQQVLDWIAAQTESFAVLNHPNWYTPPPECHFPLEWMAGLKTYAGIEIYNGVIERLPGVALATDRWDQLLSGGCRVWGYGHDDAHIPADVGLGWNVVQSPGRSAADIVAALREGRFYVSTGVDIQSIRIIRNTVEVITTNASRIQFISRWGVVCATVGSQAADFTVPANPDEAEALSYVRVECHGTGNARAWTQPLWITTQ